MQKEPITLSFDAIVIGGGIAGGEAALNMANNGYKVILIEKRLSLGGKMIICLVKFFLLSIVLHVLLLQKFRKFLAIRISQFLPKAM